MYSNIYIQFALDMHRVVVPHKDQYLSLGKFCTDIRRSYKLKKEYEENPDDEEIYQKMLKTKRKLPDEHIKRLEEIGFDFDCYYRSGLKQT